MPTILFISHDASRTGAPILLLRLMEALVKKTTIKVVTLLKRGGDMETDFKALGPTYIWGTPDQRSRTTLGKRVLRRLKVVPPVAAPTYNSDFLTAFKKVDFVFNNTVTNAPLLRQLPIGQKKVFSYFHEMQVITEMMSSADDASYLASISEKIFVPAVAVQHFFQSTFDIAESKFVTLKYIIPNVQAVDMVSKADASTITNKKFVAGFCGTLHWRKGYEFLPLILKDIVVNRQITDIHFTWIGANLQSLEYAVLKNDLIKLGLSDYVTCIPSSPSIQKYLADIDVFVLPSREDAFPLVVLEAAAVGKPSVYFNEAGGIGEFVADDAGIGVGYLNLAAMADAIVRLKSDLSLRQALGKKAMEKLTQFSDAQPIIDLFLSTVLAN